MALGGKSKGLIITAITVLVIAVVVVSSMSFMSWRNDQREQRRLEPLLEAARIFPVPGGATPSMPESTSTDPLTVTLGWNTNAPLEQSCSSFGNAYRNWFGSENAQPTGEYAMGQSCSFSGRRGEFNTSLIVAVYGEGQPQATLTVTK